jgi:hypothetical protein
MSGSVSKLGYIRCQCVPQHGYPLLYLLLYCTRVSGQNRSIAGFVSGPRHGSYPILRPKSGSYNDICLPPDGSYLHGGRMRKIFKAEQIITWRPVHWQGQLILFLSDLSAAAKTSMQGPLFAYPSNSSNSLDAALPRDPRSQALVGPTDSAVRDHKLYLA